MSDESLKTKRPVGRQTGWRKGNAKRVTLTGVPVEKDLADWLEAERVRRKRSTLTDLIRVILMEERERREGGITHE